MKRVFLALTAMIVMASCGNVGEKAKDPPKIVTTNLASVFTTIPMRLRI